MSPSRAMLPRSSSRLRLQLADVAAQLVGHLVERRGEAADLVVGANVDVGVEVTGSHSGRGAGELGERPGRQPRQPPPDEGGQDEGSEEHRGEQCLQPGDTRPADREHDGGPAACDGGGDSESAGDRVPARAHQLRLRRRQAPRDVRRLGRRHHLAAGEQRHIGVGGRRDPPRGRAVQRHRHRSGAELPPVLRPDRDEVAQRGGVVGARPAAAARADRARAGCVAAQRPGPRQDPAGRRGHDRVTGDPAIDDVLGGGGPGGAIVRRGGLAGEHLGGEPDRRAGLLQERAGAGARRGEPVGGRFVQGVGHVRVRPRPRRWRAAR